MMITKVSSQRQITIPKDYMNKLDLEPESEVQVILIDGGLTIKPLSGSVIDRIVGAVKVDKNKKGKSFKEIKKITARNLLTKMANEK